jgi:O-antigen ligase
MILLNKCKSLTLNIKEILLIITVVSVLSFDYTFLNILRKHKATFSPLFITTSIFTLFFVLHTLFGLSVVPSISVHYCLTLVFNTTLIFSLSNNITNKKDIETIMTSIIVLGVLLSIYVLAINHNFPQLDCQVPVPFFPSKTYSHNTIPVICGLSILFLSYFIKDKKIAQLFILLQLYFVLFILLSGARKAFILALFGLIFYPFLFCSKGTIIGKSRNFLLILASLLLIFFVLGNLPIFSSSIGDRFDSFINGLFGEGYTDSSSITRSIMIETALNLIGNRFWVGYGLFSFASFPGSFGTWCHNNYLEILVSGGILPLLVFYSFHLYALIKLLSNNRKNNFSQIFICILVYLILVHDMLSVDYLGRTEMILLCLIDSFLEKKMYIFQKNKKVMNLQKSSKARTLSF